MKLKWIEPISNRLIDNNSFRTSMFPVDFPVADRSQAISRVINVLRSRSDTNEDGCQCQSKTDNLHLVLDAASNRYGIIVLTPL
jgi:hypothetical protein